jgi:hypothetical protein
LAITGCETDEGTGSGGTQLQPQEPSPLPVATGPPAPRATPDPNVALYTVTLDTARQHPISPLIYGVANSGSGDEDHLRWLGVTLLRWGGNARTRHNWEINASNAGSDWEFRNVSQGDSTPGSASMQFIQRNNSLGATSLLTIPNIGWVAKDGDHESRSFDVPSNGGPRAVEGQDAALTRYSLGTWSGLYDPTENRNRTSVLALPTKGATFSYPPDLTDGKVYQDEWVHYLRENRPQGTPPLLYSMDNEPELWADDTHVDVFPVRRGYGEMLSTFLSYARAVKSTDPEGLVAGPESWGLTGYLYSPLDEGGDNFNTAAERRTYAGVPFLQWFLESVRMSDVQNRKRSLDILSVHYYPHGNQAEGNNEPEMQERRVQAPRALWDDAYIEPSWVAKTEWANLALLRRLKKMIDEYYPGTRLGIGEWNYGGEDDISGAIATADVLGIYGREDVYYAAYWGMPPVGSPTGWAFRLYRNYDGNGATFGSTSVRAVSSNTDLLSSYAALDDRGSKLTIVLINRDPRKAAEIVLNTGGFKAASAGLQYKYGSADLSRIVPEPLEVTGLGEVHVTVPSYSMTLVELTSAE